MASTPQTPLRTPRPPVLGQGHPRGRHRPAGPQHPGSRTQQRRHALRYQSWLGHPSLSWACLFCTQSPRHRVPARTPTSCALLPAHPLPLRRTPRRSSRLPRTPAIPQPAPPTPPTCFTSLQLTQVSAQWLRARGAPAWGSPCAGGVASEDVHFRLFPPAISPNSLTFMSFLYLPFS